LAIRTEFMHAFCRWRKRPALALTAIATLALGIGTASAIFSVADGVLLRPLPWSDPDRLVAIWVVRPPMRTNPVFSATWDRFPVSWTEFRNLQQHSRTLDAVAIWSRPRQVTLGGARDVVRAMPLSAGFLPMLGVTPFAGRFFTSGEDEAPSESVVLSHETWRNRFGADAAIVGRRLMLDERPFTVVGVLPPGFRFDAETADVVLPFGALPAGERNNSTYPAVARLAPGATLAQAADDVEPILRGDETRNRRTARLEPLTEQQLGASRRPILLLLTAAALLLMIACANVAGLLIGDAQTRRTEIAVRQALGAGRFRIVRQLLVESSLLAAGGGALGIVAGWWITPALVAVAPAGLPRLETVTVDSRVLAFAVTTTALTALIFGMWPAFAAAGRGTVAVARSHIRVGSRASGLIVVGQVGLAVVLVSAAALLGESVVRLASEPVGFAPDDLIVMRVRPPRIAPPDAAARTQLRAALLDRIRRVPGVQSAAATTAAPFGGNFGSQSVEAEGRPGEPLPARRHAISDGYFATLGMTIVRGRDFGATDAGSAPIAIVSEELNRRYYGGGALGRRLRVNQQWFTIVGIVPDHKLRHYDEEVLPAFFLFAPQVSFGADEIVIRAGGGADGLIGALRDAVAVTDPRLAIVTIERMDTLMRDTIATERYQAVLSSAFGGTAMMLAAIGLYGLLYRRVEQRRREIGIRLAIGAPRSDVVRGVFTEGGRLVAAGLVLGTAAALAAGQLLRAQLYAVEPTAPHVHIMTAAALSAAAVAATCVPALRASRVDPAGTLRSE
jgi:putative ABC transport system permease protein